MCVSQAWIWLRINRPLHIEEGMRAGRILFSYVYARRNNGACLQRAAGRAQSLPEPANVQAAFFEESTKG